MIGIPTKIEFYDTHIGKKNSGFYVIEGETITVSCVYGIMTAPLPLGTREELTKFARTLLRELARVAAEGPE
jgi:hypothetical protein